MKKFVSPYGATFRRNIVLSMLGLFAFAVLARVIHLQIYQAEFLVKQGNSRFIRIQKEPALRGTITDRNHIPLAVSTPVSSLWVSPKEILNPPPPKAPKEGEPPSPPQDPVAELASAIGMPLTTLNSKLRKRQTASFMYIKRGLDPAFVRKVLDKRLPGVYSQREYRRFYPSADVTAQIIGYNNIDDKGLEGIEQLYNEWLSGTPGSSEVIRDLSGHVVDVLQEIKPPVQGQGIRLTIDKRLQYLTYVALLEVAENFNPKSATAVILDAKTSEVLAMVSIPSGNPNNSRERRQSLLKNRAITDTFEPGSVMKPFAIATALDANLVSPSTPINTTPGYLPVAKNVVRDMHNYGKLTVANVIKKSSNVGTCKVALRMPKEKLHAMYESLGFGQKSLIDFPGEQSGVLRDFTKINDFDYCTNAYGYGLSATALQVAQAYAVLANDGLKIPATLVKRETLPPAVRLISKRTAQQVRRMLHSAVGEGGTGRLAARGDYMSDYSVGGKTGTVHKVIKGEYAKKQYRSVFAGMAPLSDPQIVMAVMVDEPQGDKYYGGLVAAPVFAKVVGKALRVLGVSPDQTHPASQTSVIQAAQKKTITMAKQHQQNATVHTSHNKVFARQQRTINVQRPNIVLASLDGIKGEKQTKKRVRKSSRRKQTSKQQTHKQSKGRQAKQK